MSLVDNERIKLLAAALNNIAVATIIAGILGPAAGVSYGLSGAGPNRWWRRRRYLIFGRRRLTLFGTTGSSEA